MDLYQVQGDAEKAVEVARAIIDKPVKVPSTTVSAIVRKARMVSEKLATPSAFFSIGFGSMKGYGYGLGSGSKITGPGP